MRVEKPTQRAQWVGRTRTCAVGSSMREVHRFDCRICVNRDDFRLRERQPWTVRPPAGNCSQLNVRRAHTAKPSCHTVRNVIASCLLRGGWNGTRTMNRCREWRCASAIPLRRRQPHPNPPLLRKGGSLHGARHDAERPALLTVHGEGRRSVAIHVAGSRRRHIPAATHRIAHGLLRCARNDGRDRGVASSETIKPQPIAPVGVLREQLFA